MIDGVRVVSLTKISDERGCVMHMLRRDDPHFVEFGEIYFSIVNAGWVKGWHIHRVMTLNYAVIKGAIKLVLFDSRPGSATYGEVTELVPSAENYCLTTIPPGVWNATLGLGSEPSIIANCASHPHDPGEIERLDWRSTDIPYRLEAIGGG